MQQHLQSKGKMTNSGGMIYMLSPKGKTGKTMDESHKPGKSIKHSAGERQWDRGLWEGTVQRPERELSSFRHKGRLLLIKCFQNHGV